MPKSLDEWDEVANDLWRVRVPGGWIYRVGELDSITEEWLPGPTALCFVPGVLRER